MCFIYFFASGMFRHAGAAESSRIFFSAGSILKWGRKKSQHVDLLKSCSHASLLAVHSSCSTKFWKRPLYCTTITVLQLVLVTISTSFVEVLFTCVRVHSYTSYCVYCTFYCTFSNWYYLGTTATNHFGIPQPAVRSKNYSYKASCSIQILCQKWQRMIERNRLRYRS